MTLGNRRQKDFPALGRVILLLSTLLFGAGAGAQSPDQSGRSGSLGAAHSLSLPSSQSESVYSPPVAGGALTLLHGAHGSGLSQPAVSLNRSVSTAAVQRLKIENGKIWRIPTDSLFEGDQPILSSSGESILSSLRREWDASSGADETTISCFSDAVGFENFDLKLSQKRAEIVRDWLVKHKVVDPDEIKAVGFGRKHPLIAETVVDGKDIPEARRKNRRLEIKMISCLHDVAGSQGLIESSASVGPKNGGASGAVSPLAEDPDMHWESLIDGEDSKKDEKREPKTLTEAEIAARARAELFRNLPPTPENQRSGDGSFGSGGSAAAPRDGGHSNAIGGVGVQSLNDDERREHEEAARTFGLWRD